jgi:Mg-chelatase subunit ChlD
MSQKFSIVFVMDKSGSMMNMGTEPIDGLNNFYEDQQKVGEFDSTLVFFNDKVTFIHQNKSSNEIEKITSKEYSPGGMTALYDAIGKSIDYQKSIKTDNVIFVVLTDGFENCSQEYDKNIIKNLIEKMEKEYKWKFIYLGANQDSFTVGGGIGFHNTQDFEASPLGCHTLMRNVSATVSQCLSK